MSKTITLTLPDGIPEWYVDMLLRFLRPTAENLNVFFTVGNHFRTAIEYGYDVDAIFNNCNMMTHIRETAKPWLKGRGLDLGCGKENVTENAVGVDTGSDYTDCVAEERRDASDLSGLEGQDFVFSSHCLEHMEDWKNTLYEWTRVLKPGGVIFLYLPCAEQFFWYSPKHIEGHKHEFTPKIVKDELEQIGLEVVEESKGFDKMASFYVVGRKS